MNIGNAVSTQLLRMFHNESPRTEKLPPNWNWMINNPKRISATPIMLPDASVISPRPRVEKRPSIARIPGQ
ncbi:MAG: hypothetical protein IPI73_26060 [Betaproteobacteria bacterium]|nr:hypothetical protein [Betaproteobacteria bacterium]